MAGKRYSSDVERIIQTTRGDLADRGFTSLFEEGLRGGSFEAPSDIGGSQASTLGGAAYGRVDVLAVGGSTFRDDGSSGRDEGRDRFDAAPALPAAKTETPAAVTPVAPPAPEPNAAPTLDAAVLTVAENSLGPVAGFVSATDTDGDAPIYSLVNDAGGLFAIDASTGLVTVVGVPPGGQGFHTIDPMTGIESVTPAFDHETDASYTIRVRVEDGKGGSAERDYAVQIADADDAPIPQAAALAVAENSAVGTVVGTLTATDQDGDAVTWSLVNDGGGLFTVDAATGQVKVAGPLDFETSRTHEIVARADDGNGGFNLRRYTVTVGDVAEGGNVAPAFADAFPTVAEDAAGIKVADLNATDADGDSITYAIVSDASGGKFEIRNGGELWLKPGQSLDFETESAGYDLELTADDGNGHVVAATWTVKPFDRAESGGLFVNAAHPGYVTVGRSDGAVGYFADEGTAFTWDVYSGDFAGGSANAATWLEEVSRPAFGTTAVTVVSPGHWTVTWTPPAGWGTGTNSPTVPGNEAEVFGAAPEFVFRATNGYETVESTLVPVNRPVAQPASISAGGSTVAEGDAAPLAISVSTLDADGSEHWGVWGEGVWNGEGYVVVEGLGSATLSAGDDMGGGRWRVAQADLPGLTVSGLTAGTHTLTVRVDVWDTTAAGTVPNHASARTETTATLDVVVTSDAPTVVSGTVALGTMDEGSGSMIVTEGELLANASDIDSSLHVANVGADHGSFTDNGDGTWTYTPEQGFSGTVAISYDVVTDAGVETQADATLNVAAIPDLAVIGVQPASGTEHSMIPLSLTATWGDVDGSETQCLYLTGLPPGATVLVGGVPAAPIGAPETLSGHDGSTTIVPPDAIRIWPWEMSDVVVVPSGSEDFTLSVLAVATEASTGESGVVAEALAVHVVPASPVAFVTHDASGVAGQWVALDLSATSGHAVSMYLEVPAGVEVRCGGSTPPWNSSTGRWDVTGHPSDTEIRWDPATNPGGVPVRLATVATDVDGDTATSTADDLVACIDGTDLSGYAALLGMALEAAVSGNGFVDASSKAEGAGLVGSAGDDYMVGGSGDDLFVGRGGADHMVGGAGADTFILDHGGVATVGDFDAAQGDRLALANLSNAQVDASHVWAVRSDAGHAEIWTDSAGGGSSGGAGVQVGVVGIASADQAALDSAFADLIAAGQVQGAA